MGYFLALPILMVAVVLQIGFLPNIFGGLAQPELVLLIVLSWAVHAEWEQAIFWAFVGGIMQDLMSPTPVGASVITPLLIIFAIKWLESSIYRFNIIFLVGFVIFGTILHHLILVLVLGFTGYPTNIPNVVRLTTLPTIAYNLAGILPVYFVLRRIQKRIPKPQAAWRVSS
jgi:rod shape-determining protein MreD